MTPVVVDIAARYIINFLDNGGSSCSTATSHTSFRQTRCNLHAHTTKFLCTVFSVVLCKEKPT
jgi:hypothetical protein